MAVRSLGCPVRFILTAGQQRDCPQAYALIDGLPAKVVVADAAYDADRLRQAIADKDAVAVIPNNPCAGSKISYRQASLRPAPPDRMLLLKARTVPTRRNSLEKTAGNYLAVITLAATILWNGPQLQI